MANPRSRPGRSSVMMLQRTIVGREAPRRRFLMTQIAKSVIATSVIAKRVATSAPRLASRIGRALDRSVAQRYAEQRAQVDRTGFGGMV